MEVWFIILISLCLTALVKPILDFLSSPKPSAIAKLPPGPTTIPMIGNLARLLPTLRNLHAKHGPIVALRIGLRPAIFVSDRFLAHQALVQNGAVFADRPPALGTAGVITSNQRNVSSASYGPTWRLLRRNLTAEILHPSRVKSYAPARRWVLELLASRLQQPQNGAVCAVEHFQYAMFCLLVFMCFGERLSEKEIREIETVQRDMLLGFGKFNILNLWPKLTKVVFRKRWEEFLQLRRNQESVLIPHIRARKEAKTERITKSDGGDDVLTYVDTLLGLTFPDENRNLNEGEMVTLCAEFLNGGTDTTSTALQWVMANLVKHPRIQSKLAEEIMGVTGEEEEVKEEDLQKLPYLKAVILESLRLHPPGHLLLPHAVTEDDVTLGGFLVPRNGTVNFMVAEIGRDPKVWEEPMEFKPERFLVNKELAGGFDLTGSKEIKMMPFGAGRRICPAHGLAMLHLEYFVANLVRRFSWEAVDGDEVDLTEKQEFTVVMKHPLRARIFPR